MTEEERQKLAREIVEKIEEVSRSDGESLAGFAETLEYVKDEITERHAMAEDEADDAEDE